MFLFSLEIAPAMLITNAPAMILTRASLLISATKLVFAVLYVREKQKLRTYACLCWKMKRLAKWCMMYQFRCLIVTRLGELMHEI